MKNTSYTYTYNGTGTHTFKVSAYRTVNNYTYEGALSKAKSVKQVK